MHAKDSAVKPLVPVLLTITAGRRVMDVLPLADAGAGDDPIPGASRPKSLQQRSDESCNFKETGGMVISIVARNFEHRRAPPPLSSPFTGPDLDRHSAIPCAAVPLPVRPAGLGLSALPGSNRRSPRSLSASIEANDRYPSKPNHSNHRLRVLRCPSHAFIL